VANISGSYFRDHAVGIAAALRPGGVLLASGMTDQDLAMVRFALEEAGFQIEGSDSEGDWHLLVARKEGSDVDP
jgi:ribosomal protein L11 methylase PrmA